MMRRAAKAAAPDAASLRAETKPPDRGSVIDLRQALKRSRSPGASCARGKAAATIAARAAAAKPAARRAR